MIKHLLQDIYQFRMEFRPPKIPCSRIPPIVPFRKVTSFGFPD
jgi:hypothetical protein